MDRIARSLDILRKQVNDKYPGRSKTDDGWIGDATHASRSSDHNPWIIDGADRVVSALDITHDPAHGFDTYKFADMLLRNKDPRIKYVISNRRIGFGGAGPSPWQWRPYNGSNAHNRHIHISVKDEKTKYDSTVPWVLDSLADAPPPGKPKLVHPTISLGKPKLVHPTISLGMTSKDVPYIHERLGMKPYEFFGNSSMKALQEYQIKHGRPPTGIVDSATWALFEADKPFV